MYGSRFDLLELIVAASFVALDLCKFLFIFFAVLSGFRVWV